MPLSAYKRGTSSHLIVINYLQPVSHSPPFLDRRSTRVVLSYDFGRLYLKNI